MARFVDGELNAADARFALVVSRFNSFVTDRLLDGAVEALENHGAKDVMVVRVPGAFEIPVAARRIARGGSADAIVCLGAVIRGDTPHFEFISAEVTRGIGAVMEDHEIPVSFGVLTCDTVEQAIERASADENNKGAEAALSAVEMVGLFRRLDEEAGEGA